MHRLNVITRLATSESPETTNWFVDFDFMGDNYEVVMSITMEGVDDFWIDIFEWDHINLAPTDIIPDILNLYSDEWFLLEDEIKARALAIEVKAGNAWLSEEQAYEEFTVFGIKGRRDNTRVDEGRGGGRRDASRPLN